MKPMDDTSNTKEINKLIKKADKSPKKEKKGPKK